MVSTVLANVLESYLGQYLELSDTKISVGSEIKLKNVSMDIRLVRWYKRERISLLNTKTAHEG